MNAKRAKCQSSVQAACPCTQVIFVAATKADNPNRKVSEKEGQDWAASQVGRVLGF